MKNFKVLEYLVVDKNGISFQDYNGTYKRMTRKIARAFKNYVNVARPEGAPFRIAEMRVTK
jgi:hypothetical protein